MKKYFIALLAFAPFLCFGFSPSDFVASRIYLYKWTGPNKYASFSNNDYFSGVTNVAEIYSLYFNHPFAIGFTQRDTSHNRALAFPSQDPLCNFSLNTATKATPAFPIYGNSNGVNCCFSPFVYPSVSPIFTAASSLFASGYRGNGFTDIFVSNLTSYVNVDFKTVVSDVLSSTNNTYQSIVLNCLNNIHSALSGINTSINNITVDLGQLQFDYQTVNNGVLNISNYIDSCAARGVISDYQAQLYKDNIALEFSDPSTSSTAQSFARSVYDYLNERQSAASVADFLNQHPERLSDFAKSFGNSFSSAGAGHFTTPLTNEMQRMSTNWVQETKAALSNNTQKIKDDLQAWKDQLSGPNGSQAAIVSALNGAMNNTGAFKVELQNANNSVYVHLDGPITLDSAQFQDVNNKLQANFDIFHDWVYDIPESWVRYFNMFRDNSSAVLTNQSEQISLLSSLTNLLFEYSFNFTSNTMFAISNSFVGLSLTNQYLLLSDYQTFVDSSKYNDIISSLPPDLSSALSSYGFSDSSDYSGRWWAFVTANSAYQSTLLSTNAALASILRSALEQIDDDEEGSLLSRWLSLIDSIPDPEEIQQYLYEATNIVSNIGFDRVDTLYSTATQDLVSVVKGIYQDKSLPDSIRFVFIPAGQGRDEKFVDIPVGEHSSLWSLFRSGMAFALSVVTLLLFPKYVSWLVSHYTRLVERIIKSLHAYTHQ